MKFEMYNVHSSTVDGICSLFYTEIFELFSLLGQSLSWNFCHAIKLFRPLHAKRFFSSSSLIVCVANELKLIFVQTNALDATREKREFELKKRSVTTDKNGYIPINFTFQIWNEFNEVRVCLYCICVIWVFRNSNRYIKISILMIRSIAHFISMK